MLQPAADVKLTRSSSHAETAVKSKIIVNPMANKGGCGKRWPQIRAELEKHLGPIDDDDIAMTRARNHATKLAQPAAIVAKFA